MMEKLGSIDSQFMKDLHSSQEEIPKSMPLNISFSNNNNVACISPDSTVKTEIPAELRFPDFVDFNFPSATEFSNDFATLIGTAISGSEQEAANNSNKMDGIICVDGQNLEYLINAENSESSLHTAHGSGEQIEYWTGSAKHSTNGDWAQSNYARPDSAWSDALIGSNSAAMTNMPLKKDIYVTSQLKSLILSEDKRKDTLLALLKQQHSVFGGNKVPFVIGNGAYLSNRPSEFLPENIAPNADIALSHPIVSTVDPSAIFNSFANTNGLIASSSRTSLLSEKQMKNNPVNSDNPNSSAAASNNQIPSSSNLRINIPNLIPLENTSPVPKNVVSSSRQKVRTRTTSCLKKDGGRLHPCTICTKSFKDRFSLEAHFRIHTGERPFKCGICGKGFKQKAHMQKHSTMHLASSRDRIAVTKTRRDNNRKRSKAGIDKTFKRTDMLTNCSMTKPDANFNHMLYAENYSDSKVTTTTHGEDSFSSAIDKSHAPDSIASHYSSELCRRLTSRPYCIGITSESASSDDSKRVSLQESVKSVDMLSSYSDANLPMKEEDKRLDEMGMEFSPLSSLNSKCIFNAKAQNLPFGNSFGGINVNIKEEPLDACEDIITYTISLSPDSGDSNILNSASFRKNEIRFVRVLKHEANGDREIFQCTLCKKCFEPRQELIDHIKLHKNWRVKSPDTFTSEIYPCMNCGKEYTHQEYLMHSCLVGV